MKPVSVMRGYAGLLPRPVRGAWVETLPTMICWPVTVVPRPVRGAWVET